MDQGGSGDCLYVDPICQANSFCLIYTLNFYVYKNTFIINVAWWSCDGLELWYCSQNTLSPLFIKTTWSSISPLSSFSPDFSSSPIPPWVIFPSIAVLKVKSHFSLHWAQLQLATGFRCAALSHSGALQVQPAAQTIDYVSWVLKNRASF